MLVSEKVGKGSGLTDSGRIQESKYYYQRGVAEDILSLKAVKQQFRRSLTTGIPRQDSWNTIYKALCTIFKEHKKAKQTCLLHSIFFFLVNIFHTVAELLLLITVWTHSGACLKEQSGQAAPDQQTYTQIQVLTVTGLSPTHMNTAVGHSSEAAAVGGDFHSMLQRKRCWRFCSNTTGVGEIGQ